MNTVRHRPQRKHITWILLALAVVLLVGSAIGSTRAALVYYSENYTAEITVSQIGVSLLENGEVVSSRDYENKEWKVTSNGEAEDHGALLQNLLADKEKLVLNKKYPETLAVKNSGVIDEYVRVRIYKYWTKGENGSKLTTLSPDLIDLHLTNTDKWAKQSGSTTECTELYYKDVLPSGSTTPAFVDSVRIDGQVAAEAKVETKGNIITTTYTYDGVQFHVDVEVDAVQTHNAKDAIKSAWGVDAGKLGITVDKEGQ